MASRKRMHGRRRHPSRCTAPFKKIGNPEGEDDLPLFGHDSTDEAGDIPDLNLSTEQRSSSTRVAGPNIPNIPDPDYVPPSEEEVAKNRELIKSGEEHLKKKEDEYWDTWKKRAHTTLSVAGVVFPGADLFNAGLYALEGDWKNAAMAGAASIPIIGDTYAASKLAYKAGDTALDIVKTGTKTGAKTRSVKTGVEETVGGIKNIPKDIAKGNYKDAVTNIGSAGYWYGTGQDVANDPLATGEGKKKKYVNLGKAEF